jgi:protease-4
MKPSTRSFLGSLLGSILGVFIAIGLSVLLLFVILGVFVAASQKKVSIAKDTVLTINLDDEITQRPSESPLDILEDLDLGLNASSGISVKELTDAIYLAKDDENVKGLYLTGSIMNVGLATADEVRIALEDFKKSGKFIVSYSEALTNKAYFTMTSSSEIYLHPEGVLGLTGFHSEQMFLKGMFEKLDIDIQLFRAGKYKSAGETFIKTNLSEENRFQITEFMNSNYSYFINKISGARKIDTATTRRLISNLEIRYPEDAKKAKLIDGITYYDEVLSIIKEKADWSGKHEHFLTINKYNKYLKENKKSLYKGKDKIAVIYANGDIAGGNGDENSVGSEKLSETIRRARNDKKVKAIVLRVVSPGGGSLASDVIWREVKLASDSMPVIVSMGDVAASGGYLIAAPATTIMADPTSITGSIGVFALLPNLSRFWNSKTGISWDRVSTGKYADLGNPNRPITEGEKSIIQHFVDTTYYSFKSKVAKGRNLPIETVDALAQGRVYSGIQALDLKLVDTLGTLNNAIELAAKKAGLDEFSIKNLPDFSKDLPQFMRALGSSIFVKENTFTSLIINEITRVQDLINEKTPLMYMPYSFDY